MTPCAPQAHISYLLNTWKGLLELLFKASINCNREKHKQICQFSNFMCTWAMQKPLKTLHLYVSSALTSEKKTTTVKSCSEGQRNSQRNGICLPFQLSRLLKVA